MNISQAKDQIKYAIKSYFTKDESGEYLIPIERQRPIFLMGPPGIGKTAIMEQIANELGIGLVTYSMTHHTRQSALGLPFIVKRTYGGKEYSVSEYTMSEIIASVYNRMEEDGVNEGILFLDEINCVSETLAPSMLQFLQYKTFGTHRVPGGWIVVTAGNPPEYNDSVREFDIVTWDRLKRIDIEPDFKVWKEYARSKGVHPAIITFLEIKEEDFYLIETTVDGKRFVTARGWVDLSDMIMLFEQNGYRVDETLVLQYLQDARIAKEFSVYYDLFQKYKSDYQIDSIISGHAPIKIFDRAKKAKFDERLSLLALLFDAVCGRTREVVRFESKLRLLMNSIKAMGLSTQQLNAEKTINIIAQKTEELLEKAHKEKRSNAMSSQEYKTYIDVSRMLKNMEKAISLADHPDGKTALDKIKSIFYENKDKLTSLAEDAKKCIDNSLLFCFDAFGLGQELVLIVTEMTTDRDCASFINQYGSEQYYRFNQELLINERQIEILEEIEKLEL